MKRRILSMFLVFAMVFSFVVMPASAEVYKGKRGSISWSFDSDSGILTISGTGKIGDNYWNKHRDYVTEVVIEEGITSIGLEVLSKHYSLETVHLPLSLTNIEASVFLHSPVSSIIYAGTEEDWWSNVAIDYWIEWNPVFDDIDAFTFLGVPTEKIKIEYYYDIAPITTEQYVSVSLPNSVTAVTERGEVLTMYFNCPSVDFTVAGEHRICAFGTIPDGYYMDGCEDGTFEVQFSVFVNPAPSGKCGDNLSWLIRNGTLEITGSGDMYAYDNDIAGKEIPWKNYAASIQRLSLSANMTSFSKDFIAGTNVTRVYLPAALSKIADGAFRNASQLEVVLGNDYFEREHNGFALYTKDMTKLVVYALKNGVSTGFYVPQTVTEIAPYAFEGTHPTTVYIPKSVTAIGTKAFHQNITLVGHKNSVTQQYAQANGNPFVPTSVRYIESPKPVTVTVGSTLVLPTETIGWLETDESVIVYLSYDSVPDTNTVKTVRLYPSVSVRENVDIPDPYVYVDVIVEEPRYEGTSNNVSWLLQDGLLTLSGNGAMGDEIPWADYMDEIKSVSIGSGITYIPEGAFAGMNVEGISSQSASYPVKNGVLFYENTLFCYPAKLAGNDYNVADDVTAIAEKAFAYAVNLQTVTIRNTVEEIGADAFIGTNLKLIVDERSAAHTYVRENGIAFELIPAEIIETGSYSGFTYTVDANYHMRVSGSGYVPQTYYLRPDCYEEIKTITFEEGITGLDTYITYFRNVEEINFPASAFALYAFVDIDCPNLKRITVADGNENFYVVDDVLFQHTLNAMIYYPSGKTDRVYTVPANCQWMNDPFAGSCPNLEELRIGKNVQDMNNNIENCVGLKSIVVDAGNDYFTSVDGVLYDDNCQTLIQFPVAHQEKNFTVPATVKTIGTEAFFGAQNLETVSMGNSVTEIEIEAFRECPNLTTVTLSDNIKEISSRAFYQCPSLTQINLPASLEIVYNKAFYECENLAIALDFPDGMKEIGEGAFEGCTSISSVSIPSGTEIDRYAFWGCGMQELSLAEGITTIENYAFHNCSNLESVVIPSTLKVITHHLFDGCEALKTVTLKEGLEEIENDAFASCTSLETIVLPESIRTLDSSVFDYCSALKTVTIPDSITELPYGLFYYCTALESVQLPQNLEIIGGSAFYRCVSLESIQIPDTVHTIESYAFYRCEKLTEITLPDSVQTIEDDAFYYCTALERINIPDGVTEIPSYAFRNCKKLKEMILPETVTTIGSRAFYDCVELEKIVIPESVTGIGSYAFSNCSKLTIYGKVNSYAHTYAINNNIPFVGMEKTIVSVGDAWNNLTGAELLVGDEYSLPDGVWCEIESETKTVVLDIVYDDELDTSYPHTQTITATLVVPDGYNLATGIVTEKVLHFTVSYPFADGKMDAISWNLSDGVLTVSGTGAIGDFIYDDYTGACNTPWFPYADFIYRIVIEPGITAIGNNAFRYLRQVESISIPEGVVAIGASAFEGASAETKGIKLNLPSTLVDLGQGAFENMSIREITLPAGITYLPDDLFYKSPYLTTVYIEGKLTNIGESAFYGCPIQVVYFSGTTAEWNRITIAEKGNEDFIGAYIYCNDPIDIPLDEPKVDYEIDQNTATADFVVDVPKSAIEASPNGTGEIIAIGFGANGYQIEDSTPIKGTGSYDVSVNTKDVTEVKIFIWDSLENMRPLALPVTVKIPGGAGGN